MVCSKLAKGSLMRICAIYQNLPGTLACRYDTKKNRAHLSKFIWVCSKDAHHTFSEAVSKFRKSHGPIGFDARLSN